MRSHRRTSERGQGLVEYALILVLVGIVVIVALTTAGEKVRDIFCDVVINLDPGAASSQPACAAPRVSLSINDTSPGKINMEAVVKDDKGSTQPNITSVKFYVDGSLLRTESLYKYCLGGGGESTPCQDQSLSSGSHEIRAVATDADGNTGEATISVNVP
jgi:Flp pilus assembly pilin Flp